MTLPPALQNSEEKPNLFFSFTLGFYNTLMTIFAVFICWLFYQDVVQHLGYQTYSFLYFYFMYMLLSCVLYILKSPAEMLSFVETGKSEKYKTFSKYYPTLKVFVVAVSYGLFKLIEWLFV